MTPTHLTPKKILRPADPRARSPSQTVSKSKLPSSQAHFRPWLEITIERSFEEERRRTKVIPRLMSEKATMKLAFATMIRAAERWCRVSITDIERHQLRLLRAELGLDPPPRSDEDEAPSRRRAHRAA